MAIRKISSFRESEIMIEMHKPTTHLTNWLKRNKGRIMFLPAWILGIFLAYPDCPANCQRVFGIFSASDAQYTTLDDSAASNGF